MSISTPGIKYIKISKLDNNGVDLNSPLGELSKLILKYSDIGNIEYDIINISDQQDHYLYTIYTNNNTSSLDNEVIDYGLNIPLNSSPLNIISSLGNVGLNWGTPSIDIQNNWDSNFNGRYLITKSSNAPVSISFNFTIIGMTGTTQIQIISSRFGILVSNNFSNGTHTLTIPPTNIFQNDNIRISIQTKFNGSISGNFIIQNQTGGFPIQSITPTLTVLSPNLPPNFYNSDCNPTINNAIFNTLNLKQYKVDYPQASIIPQNQSAILSGSATIPETNLSNYTTLRHIKPRYEGSKLIGNKINSFTQGDISFGKTPVIEQTQKYFGYFEWIGSWDPELKSTSALKLKFLIDKDGNSIISSNEDTFYYDLINNFTENQNITITPDSVTPPGDLSLTALGEQRYPVVKPGLEIVPILHTDGGVLNSTSSSLALTGSLRFYQPGTNWIADILPTFTRFNANISPNIIYVRFNPSLLNDIINTPPTVNQSTTFGNILMLNQFPNSPILPPPQQIQLNVFQDGKKYGGLNIDSKYFDIKDKFTILPGDEFRYKYDESLTFRVRSVIPVFQPILGGGFGPSPQYHIQILLDKPLPTSITNNDLQQNFLLRRYKRSSSVISITYDKQPGPNMSGFVFPEFVDKEILNNKDRIIEKIKRDNII